MKLKSAATKMLRFLVVKTTSTAWQGNVRFGASDRTDDLWELSRLRYTDDCMNRYPLDKMYITRQ